MKLLVTTVVLIVSLNSTAVGIRPDPYPYYKTIRNCDHGHRSTVAKHRIQLLLGTTSPRVKRAAVRHYTRCVFTEAKRRRLQNRVVEPGWKARKRPPLVYAIWTNRDYADLLGYLAAIRACESTNNPRAISPGGAYRGWYQFSFSTWRTVGGSGDPADAHPYEQTFRAAKLLRTGGPGHWPNCPHR